MTATALTDIKVKAIRNVSGVRMEIKDATAQGLYLVVQPSGAKSWAWRAKANGRKMRVGVGPYPAVGLADARAQARELARMKERGIDPVEQKQASRAAARAENERRRVQQQTPVSERGGTFRALANEWLRRVHDEPALRQAKETRRYVEKYLSDFLDREAASISRQDIVRRIAEIEEEHGATTAHHALKVAKAIYNWAVEKGWTDDRGREIDRNPADKLKSPRSPKDSARQRRLTNPEIIAFWNACDVKEGNYGKAFQLLLLSAQRLREVLDARWSEFDFELMEWRIPSHRMKMGREHLVPVTPQMKALLDAVPRLSGCDLVFPSRRSTERCISGDSKVKARIERRLLDKLGTLEPWVLHDIRRSCATELQRQGFRAEVIEAVQSRDTATGTAAHYHLYNFADEKREALNSWNCHVQQICEAKS